MNSLLLRWVPYRLKTDLSTAIHKTTGKMYRPFLFAATLLLSVISPCISQPNGMEFVIPEEGSIVPDTRPANDPFIEHTADLSVPYPTKLQWQFQRHYPHPSFNVFLSKNRMIDPTDRIVSAILDNELSVWNLMIGTTYYWKIIVRSNGIPIRETRTYTFSTPSLWPRMIYIDGTTNVRDIGGRPNKYGHMIRQGLFYRSAEFSPSHPITSLGIEQIRQLAIQCEVDLRGSSEDSVCVLPGEIRYYRPCKYGEYLYAYWYGLVNCHDKYRDTFKEMAKIENYPMILHCQLGADRTSTVCALLEAILDCTEEQILLNYQWTSLSVYGPRGCLGAYGWNEWNEMIAQLKYYDTINGSIQIGARNYLVSIGVTTEELNSIRDIFLGDVPQQILDHGGSSVGTQAPQFPARQKVVFSGSTLMSLGSKVKAVTVFNLLGQRIWSFERGSYSSNLLNSYTHPLRPRGASLVILEE